jgi:hypothetical protein
MAISKATAGMKRPRSVRFNTTVKHVLDTSRDQVRTTWYNKDELSCIKGCIKTDLCGLFSGRIQGAETNSCSWRGLETYTQRHQKNLYLHRKERRAFLISGVKNLQQRLSAEGLSPEGAIRKLCTISSMPAVQEAQHLAQLDSLDANQIYLETFLLHSSNAVDKYSDFPPMVASLSDDLPGAHQQLVAAITA